MSEMHEINVTDELKKLASIATDMQLSGKMRQQAISQLSEMGSHEALLVLLNLAANDKILYLREGNKVVIKPLKGNILDLKGSVKTKDKHIDLKKLRSETKKKVAHKIAQDR